MIISFGYTKQYLLAGKKTCTRRVWKPKTFQSCIKAYDDGMNYHTAVDKQLSYGGRRIGTILLTERPYLQRLTDMPEEDLVAEGGMVATLNEFIDKYFNGNANTEVAVLRFDFIPRELIVNYQTCNTIWVQLEPGDVISWKKEEEFKWVIRKANKFGVELNRRGEKKALVVKAKSIS